MKRALAIALVLSLPASAVFAHADLASGAPAEGATLAAPAALTLTFSEPVTPAFTGIRLKGADGGEVAVGVASFSADGLTLTVPTTTNLAPGAYVVTWHALSEDGHKSQGSYGFTVK